MSWWWGGGLPRVCVCVRERESEGPVADDPPPRRGRPAVVCVGGGGLAPVRRASREAFAFESECFRRVAPRGGCPAPDGRRRRTVQQPSGCGKRCAGGLGGLWSWCVHHQGGGIEGHTVRMAACTHTHTTEQRPQRAAHVTAADDTRRSASPATAGAAAREKHTHIPPPPKQTNVKDARKRRARALEEEEAEEKVGDEDADKADDHSRGRALPDPLGAARGGGAPPAGDHRHGEPEHGGLDDHWRARGRRRARVRAQTDK